jgi:hypothetical protein
MIEGLLPVGSVVLLKDSTKKVMIIGVCQKEVGQDTVFWDYSGCLFPEGYMGADKTFLFNNDQIESVYSLGYQDEEQLQFKKKAEEVMERLRKGE